MNETLNRINWEAVSAITALLSFLGLAFTLREMKKQRIHTYIPVLVITNPHFIISNNSQGIPSIWKHDIEEKADEYNIWYELNLNNIGFGTANEVKVEWIIDIDKLNKNINEVDSENYYVKQATDNHYLYNEFGFFISDDNRDIIDEIPFVTNGQAIKTRMPSSVKDYISFYYLAKGKQVESFKYIEAGELPIIIKVSCIDLSAKPRIYEYKIKYDLYVDVKNIDKPNMNVIYGKMFFINIKRLTTAST